MAKVVKKLLKRPADRKSSPEVFDARKLKPLAKEHEQLSERRKWPSARRVFLRQTGRI